MRLFQLAFAQVHSDKIMQHFGSATIEDILHTPIQALPEQQGVDVSAAVATDFQIKVFTEDTRMALDAITSPLDKVEVAGYVQQAQEFQGSGLFMFVLDRAAKHVAEHAKYGNTPSPFATRIAYEQILGAAFKSTWQEKKGMDEKQRTEEEERPLFSGGWISCSGGWISCQLAGAGEEAGGRGAEEEAGGRAGGRSKATKGAV